MGAKIDLCGRVFGRLTVLSEVPQRGVRGDIYWTVRCSCGTTKTVGGNHLRRGVTRSCGCLQQEATAIAKRLNVNDCNGRSARARLVDKAGHRYGRLVVLRLEAMRPVRWVCQCDCGVIAIVRAGELQRGTTTSCGCFHRELVSRRFRKHGTAGSRAYQTAAESRRRAAVLKRTPSWADLEAIRKFYEACPAGMHVDHEIPLCGRNVSGLHVPNNLRWLPAQVNKRKSNLFNLESQR